MPADLSAPSSVHAFRVALRDALVAHMDGGTPTPAPSLAGVRVSYGPPVPAPPAEYVWLGAARADEVARVLGKRARDESYTLEVAVSVLRGISGTDTAESAAERAHEIIGVVAGVLRDDPQLVAHYAGPGQIMAAQFAGVAEDETRANSTHVEHYALCEVSVRARI